MIISELANYLSLHPYFKSLNDNQKFLVISRAWNQIQELKTQKIELISFSPNDITFPTLYVYKQPRLSLGLTKLIDSYMSEDLFLKELTEEQRFVVYNIAQSKIERHHNLLNHQHYKINTYKEDIIHRTPLIYIPALELKKKLLETTDRIISFVIPLALRTKILDVINKTITFIPGLSLVPKVITGLRKTIIFIPSLIVRAGVNVINSLKTITLIPGLSVIANIIIGSTRKIYFIPTLTVGAEVLSEEIDYIEEITFTPSLTVSATITT